jgi:hypothetical protein
MEMAGKSIRHVATIWISIGATGNQRPAPLAPERHLGQPHRSGHSGRWPWLQRVRPLNPIPRSMVSRHVTIAGRSGARKPAKTWQSSQLGTAAAAGIGAEAVVSPEGPTQGDCIHTCSDCCPDLSHRGEKDQMRNSPSVCLTLFLIIAERDVAQDSFSMGLKLLNFVSVALLAI